MKVHVKITVTTNDGKLISCQEHSFTIDHIEGMSSLSELGPLLRDEK